MKLLSNLKKIFTKSLKKLKSEFFKDLVIDILVFPIGCSIFFINPYNIRICCPNQELNLKLILTMDVLYNLTVVTN